MNQTTAKTGVKYFESERIFKCIEGNSVLRSMLLSLLFFVMSLGGVANATTLNQKFFIPLPEQEVRDGLRSLYSSTGNDIRSVISMSVPFSGTIFHYDHWEDGYEADIENPVQSTTEIWGDGDASNGCEPAITTCTDAADVLVSGDVISLDNEVVTLPRNPSDILFDGRDFIGSNYAVAMSRAAWATSPGTVLAGAVEVYAVNKYGTQFTIPVGQDIDSGHQNQMFQYVDMHILAAQDATTVEIDADANGAVDTTILLNKGESYHVNGGVLVGGTVDASAPVQVHVMTGDVGAYYESRWFTMYPTEQWSDDYYTPVGTASDG
ncbi:MAG: IgGFc-binding protein, partial [Sulfurovum sp.]|nr:IgGFc-binding protein [Sulfurovum sp.]